MRRTETARKSRDEGFIDRLIKAVNRKSDSAKKSIAYIKKICSDPTVGAPNPGGKYLIERVLKAVNPKKCSVIIELGAGEGILTRKLLKAMPKESRLLAVEKDKEFFKAFRRMKNRRLTAYNGDARKLSAIAYNHAVENADCVICSVPFALLSLDERCTLLDDIYALLRPGGRFVACQCTTHLIPLVRQRFRKVDMEFEIRNLPPQFVFTAVKD